MRLLDEAVATADRVIQRAIRLTKPEKAPMKFTDKYPRSPESFNWLISSLRDLTVNVADFIKEPVDAVNVYVCSQQHGFTWQIAVRVSTSPERTLVGIGVDLDSAIQKLIELKEAHHVPR